MSNVASSLTAYLKDATRGLHAAAERTAFAASLVDGTVTGPAFAAHLLFFRDAHGALEDALVARRCALGAVVATRLPYLDADLTHWRAQAAIADAALPEAFQRARGEIVARIVEGDDATLAGATYVLEGAALGGAFLYPRLRAAGLPDAGLRHYAGHGEGTMPRWGRIRGVLDTVPAGDWGATVTAAKRVFANVVRAYTALEALGVVREASGTYAIAADEGRAASRTA